MWAHKVVIKNIVLTTFIMSALGIYPLDSFAKKTNKKTIGALLKNIDTKVKAANNVKIKKKRSSLPSFKRYKKKTNVNLRKIKPPNRSRLFYKEGTDEGDLEKTIDDGISQLYNLTKRFKNSSKRGELWLRLAELYVEKSRLIEYRLENNFDKKVQAYNKGKRKRKPRLNLKPAQAYNHKSIQLYEWFLRDYPKDKKVPQALLFLGYNYFEIGKVKKGRDKYLELTKKYPRSRYIAESSFALGEYYFENERWSKALKYYDQVSKNKRGRLYSFALYKRAWCLYKIGKSKAALKTLEQVIYVGRRSQTRNSKTSTGISKIRLASEAIKDLVLFSAGAGKYKETESYFRKVVDSKSAKKLMDRLAYYYSDTGQRKPARYIFRELIHQHPMSPKAFEYQYQIVMMYRTLQSDKGFKQELQRWIEDYGPESQWYKRNRKKPKVVAKSNKLIEATLRNYILQKHQTAQNSRASHAQKLASSSYDLYFSNFSKSKKIDEMHFFYAELLFDMKKYIKAAKHYLWVSDNRSKSKYYEKSIVNALLSLEKKLPKANEVKRLTGKSIEPLEFGSNIRNFKKIAQKYFKTFPDGKDKVIIKYRMGSLHYYYNQFDKALVYFREIIRDHSKSKYAGYSANLILDIYNLRKDYGGLEKAAQEILSISALAKSSVGGQIKGIQQRTGFKRIQEFDKADDPVATAKAYKAYAEKNSKSNLAVSARYNAAINFEKANLLAPAIEMYQLILNGSKNVDKKVRQNSRKYLALLYEKTGQYPEAANAFEGYAKKYPKDKHSLDFIYNAAVIRSGLRYYQNAIKNFELYRKKSHKSDRHEVLFLIARIWEKRNGLSKAISFYKQYIRSGTTNHLGIVESAYRIAKLYEKLKKKNKAEIWYKKTITTQRIFKEQGNNVGASYAAEARFKTIYKIYADMHSIRIPRNPKNQTTAVRKKLNRINKLKEQLKSVIAYDDGGMIVASLTLQGQALQHMAAALWKAPVPKGLKKEELKVYKQGVNKLAKPFQTQAIDSYKAAIQKSRDLEAYNEWVKISYKELAKIESSTSKVEEETFSLSKEDMLDLKDGDLAQAFRDGSSKQLQKIVADMLSKNEKNLIALNTLGVFYFQKGDIGLAKLIFKRALKDHESEVGLHSNLALAYLKEGDFKLAYITLKKAISLKQDHISSRLSLGSIYLTHKDYSRALEAFSLVYEKTKADLSREDATAIKAANNYAVALMRTGDNDEAKDIFKKIIKGSTGVSAPLVNFSILLTEINPDKDKAVDVVEKLQFVAENDKTRKKVEVFKKNIEDLK